MFEGQTADELIPCLIDNSQSYFLVFEAEVSLISFLTFVLNHVSFLLQIA
jgi:hypothetical protein